MRASRPGAVIELGDVMRERADKLLATAAARVKAEGLLGRAERVVGTVDEALLELAEQSEALVVGRRGEQHGTARLGEHTVRLVRRAPHPVVVAGDQPSEFARPLVAYDGSETSSAALSLAARYAATAAVPLDVVHVSDDATAARDELLARAAAFLSRTEAAYETHQLVGDVEDAITAYAVRSGADVVVCGAHAGRTGARRSWSMGSHAEALLKLTGIPTIIVR